MKTLKNILLSGIAGLALLANYGCEKEDPEQYISEGAADVRGTWYDKGNLGGWYGPDNTWGFEWYYFEQYGTNITGKYEHELYQQYEQYDYLPDLNGSVEGNKIHLVTYSVGNPSTSIEGTASGGVISFTETDLQWEYGSWVDRIEKVNNNAVRRSTPWNPGGD